MKRYLVGLFSLALACVAGRLDAAPDLLALSYSDWYEVAFEGCLRGETLGPTTGVLPVGGELSGVWRPGTTDSFVDQANGVKFLNVSLLNLNDAGPMFTAAHEPPSAEMEGYRMDCTVTFPAMVALPVVPADAKTAMCLMCDGSGTNFYAYCRNGWVRLSSPRVRPIPAERYDQRAEFHTVSGVRYVAYSIKVAGEYVPLVDDNGSSELEIASAAPVSSVEIRGSVELVGLVGKVLKSDSSIIDIAPPGYPVIVGDWFNVLMQGATTGEELGKYTGVIDGSGSWGKIGGSFDGYSAKVQEENGDRYLCIDTTNDGYAGPEFAAARASDSEMSEIEFSMRFFQDAAVLDAQMPSGTKSAMTIADIDGRPVFHGFAKDGWIPLYAKGVQPKYSVWYDMVAIFEDTGDVLYVSYAVKTFDGFVKLADVNGNTRFPTAGSGKAPVQYVDVLGSVDLKFLTGTEMKADPERSYFWIGKPYGDWNAATNWSHSAGGEPCVSGDVPGPAAAVILNSATRISIPSGVEVSNLVINADVTIEGSVEVRSTKDDDGRTNGLTGDRLAFNGIYGTGKLTLRRVVLKTLAEVSVVECALAIDDENTSGMYCDGKELAVRGGLSGAGPIIAYQADEDHGVTFGGMNVGYTGVFTETVIRDADFGRTCFTDGLASFPNATVNLLRSINVAPDDVQAPFGTGGDIYEFGAYNGHLISAQSLPTIVIGGRGEDCAVDGQLAAFAKDAAHGCLATLVKVGTGRLTADLTNIGVLEIQNGELELVGVDPMYKSPKGRILFAGGTLLCRPEFDPSEYISGSSGPITFDDDGTDNVWKYVLDASNVGGLTKRGTGTLTLTKIPAYAGRTTVEAGRLIIPFGTVLGDVEIGSAGRLLVDLSGITDDDRLLFAASSLQGLPDNPNELFINAPPGFVIPEPTRLPGGGIIYSRGSRIYRWTGKADNGGLWSTVGNWEMDGVPAIALPGRFDIVEVPAGKDQIVVDIPASVWMLTCAAGVQPLIFTTPPITNDAIYAGDNTSMLTVGAGSSLPGVSGVGGLQVSDPLVISAAADEVNKFIGSISAPSFTKTGDGEVVLAGANSFGSINIASGTLKVGSHLDIDDVRMDFDAADRLNFEVDSIGNVTKWHSSVGDYTFNYSAGAYAKLTGDYFSGVDTLMFRQNAANPYSRYVLSPSNNESAKISKSLFILYHSVRAADGSYLYAETSEPRYGMKILGAGANHCWGRASNNSTSGFFTGTDATSAIINDNADYLSTWVNTPFRSSSGISEYLGTSADNVGFRGAVAEVVTYSRVLSHPERLAVQRSLMVKWGIGGGYEVLPARASLTMAEGSVLDLGGMVQTVASFSGAGTVGNGILLTADGKVTLDGFSLSIPAVNGTIYSLPKDRSELSLTDGLGTRVTVVIPDDCTSSRVFFEGSVNWRKTNDAITISGPDADGWYYILNNGGGSCIIIR